MAYSACESFRYANTCKSFSLDKTQHEPLSRPNYWISFDDFLAYSLKGPHGTKDKKKIKNKSSLTSCNNLLGKSLE